MKKRDYRYTLCFFAAVICLALILPVGQFMNSTITEEKHSIERDFGVEQFSSSQEARNVLGGKETAFYGMADNDTVRNLVGYADYLVVSHALWSGGETIRDNVRYLSDNGVKIILVCGWWDIWPFTSAGVNGWDKMHYEDVVYGMNATESVKYRIRQCMDTIGSEYIWGISIGEEEPGGSNYPWPFIAWYMNLFYDWINEEYPGVKAVQWPSPHTYATNPTYELKADAIIYDNYNQIYTDIAVIGEELKEAYPDIPLIYIISAVEHTELWFTCHPATYTKQAIDAIAPYADVIGFWVTEEGGTHGWQTNHPSYQLALRFCNEIHLMDWNTIHGTTEWFECGFGNDSVTEALDNWYTSYWYTETPDSSLSVGLTSDYAIGNAAINLTCTTAGTHSYWWQKLGHDYGFADYIPGVPYAPINMTDASRLTFWVKGIGWDNHPEAEVTMYIEKSNYPVGAAGNLTLPDFTSLLSDGAWHQVQVDLPLDSSSYYEWDGYASQIHFVVDYLTDVGGDTTTILFDGFIVESFDTGKAKGLSTTSDYVWAENGTLRVGGDAFFEGIFTQADSWFYRYSGTGIVELCINGTWTTPPDQGILCYWNVTGFRLYNGSYDWIEFHCIPPFVEILNPSEGETISGIVNVEVNATDESGIDRVWFYVDEALQHTDDTYPYTWDWDTLLFTDGSHDLNVTALSNNGTLNFHLIVVNVDNTKPVIVITSPLNESLINDAVQLNVSASDSSGIAQVEFYVEGVLLAIDTNAPYSTIWDTFIGTDGAVNLTCIARDAAGNAENSMHLLIVDNTNPTASIRSVVVGADSVFVSLNASDASGVNRVEFVLNGGLQYTDYSYPFEWTWLTSTHADGVYAIEGFVYDSLGHMTVIDTDVILDHTSPALSITLNPLESITHGIVTVTATTSDASGISQVDFYVDGGLEFTSLSGPHVMFLDTTLLSSGNHTLVVIAIDSYGNTKQMAHILMVDNSGPEISIVSPLNGTVFEGSTSVFVRIETDDIGGIGSVILSYSTGGSWSNITMIENGGFYDVSLPILGIGTVLSIQIYANDTFGTSASTSIQTYYIVDTSGPTMTIPIISPSLPTPFDSVMVMLMVTDSSVVDSVVLSYQVDYGIWMNISMSWNSVYWAIIPAQTTGSEVNYQIYANDTLGQRSISPIFEYVVVSFDVLPPFVIDYNWLPLIPDDSETVEVKTNVTDSSGVISVILSYYDGTQWTNLTMGLVGGLFIEHIPALPYGTIVTMKLYSCDGQGNWGVTPFGSYEIVSSDLDGPNVLILTWSPSDPTEENDVEVYAELFDMNGIRKVILCYSQGTMFANVSMTFNGTGYVTIIGSHSIGTEVSFCIYSCDTRDNWAIGVWEMYVVQASDITSPLIVSVDWTPHAPFSNESININAIISDENTIILVLLGYYDGYIWRNLTMVQMSSDPNLFVVQIPAIGEAGTIPIWVLAQDSKGNWGYTDFMDIEIQQVSHTTTSSTTVSTGPTTASPPPDTLFIGVIGALVVGLPGGIVVGVVLSRLFSRNRGSK